jgi:hypothetical protein
MPRRLLSLLGVCLLASCAWSVDSNWYLLDEGYSINPVAGDASAYAVEVHLNQLKQLGGDVNNAQFNQFVAERLKLHGVCPAGWKPALCIQDGSCIQRTGRSVTVTGRCT